ncbi:Anaphase-promoting complex subunit 2 [Mortierella sp. NVP85]|nr:Anaphase-promoting complex subunit 2 [Mortierella sp. NVP85]
MFRKDALENVIPLLENIETQYQDYVAAGPSQDGSTDWVIPAFHNVIDAIHTRFAVSRQLARIFDERLRVVSTGEMPLEFSSLEVSSRFLMDFAAELVIRLPPSFNQVAHLYFETTFRQFEASHPSLLSGGIYHDNGGRTAETTIHHPEQPPYSQGESEPGDAGDQQQRSRRKRSQNQQNVMDMLDEDDTDDELVERLFHEGHSAASAESLAKGGPMQPYLDLCHKMEEIGFGSRMTDVVTRVLYDRVEAKIFNSFKRRWDTATLDRGDPITKKRYKMWSSRLLFYFHKTFGDLRIKEFFDIVVECPDSEPAVLDLQECIEWTGQREQLQNAFLATIDKRLMHPGAETTDIVEFYISTIKYLRVLDPSGVMLEHASGVIGKYLRTREDTMRAIVSCIVDDSNDLLTNIVEGAHANAEMDDEGTDDEMWVPEPKNAGPDLSSAKRRMADIISVLANIYRTNDRFMEEFQAILADRLLKATDFNIDREVRQLELLKLRFKEEELHNCEVMLADMTESKRVNANVYSLHPDIPVSATIASRCFWPQLENETLELPGLYSRMLESYTEAFHELKPAQQLTLFPALGMVELEIELEDRTLHLNVEPIHASIIHLFEEQETWTLSDLAQELRVTEEALEEKMEFWIQEGVIREMERSHYQLIENATSSVALE